MILYREVFICNSSCNIPLLNVCGGKVNMLSFKTQSYYSSNKDDSVKECPGRFLFGGEKKRVWQSLNLKSSGVQTDAFQDWIDAMPWEEVLSFLLLCSLSSHLFSCMFPCTFIYCLISFSAHKYQAHANGSVW